MKVAIAGATKGMGRALARLLAERHDEVFVMGIIEDDLRATAADLEQRGAKGKVGTAWCDLLDPATFAPALDEAEKTLGGLDAVVITAGLFWPGDKLEEDIELARKVVVGNFAHTVLLCEHARKRLLARGGGVLCVFSSVAGDRGRKPISIYGASKAGLSHYLESLDHKYRSQGLATITVKPGFVKTDMTAGLKPPPFAGEPEAVAARVLRAIDRRKPVVYAPWVWGWIMLVIRWLPRFVMRRIGF